MAISDENLDDVIASLLDDVDEPEVESGPSGPVIPADPSADPVILTENAARQIKKIKSQENLDDQLYLRVAVEGGGCSGLSYKLGFDHKTDADRIIESQGIEIVIDENHLIYLNGIVVDYPLGLDARGFTFDNPNATEACGCGSSFAI